MPSPPPRPQVFLIFGRNGWIGGLVGELLKAQGAKFEYATARLEDRAAVMADIERVRCGGAERVVRARAGGVGWSTTQPPRDRGGAP